MEINVIIRAVVNSTVGSVKVVQLQQETALTQLKSPGLSGTVQESPGLSRHPAVYGHLNERKVALVFKGINLSSMKSH